MGCGAGTQKEDFRDKYLMEKKLGEGAHGVVYECRHKKSGIQYAVKLLEMDENRQCLHEVKMMKRVMNPESRVVQMEDFFQDRAFCYIVMEKYQGGDLVDVVQAHLAKGKINDSVLARLFQQMMLGVAFLHGLELIHRDVKADNFLLDRFDIFDKNVRVILSDLGTVVELKPGKTLSAQVGTKIYWAPEVVKKCYSFPADVWAIGIILYGIVFGTFPFKNDEQILSKEPDFYKNKALSKDAINFMIALMVKDEGQRPTANDALKLSWIAGDKEKAESQEAKRSSQATEKEEGKSNLHLKEMDDLKVRPKLDKDEKKRRQQLVQQADAEYAKAKPTKQDTKKDIQEILGPFTTTDVEIANLVRHWDWWDVSKMDGKMGPMKKDPQSGRLSQNVAAARNLEMSWTPEVVSDFLTKKGIDVSQFGVGRANTVAHIAKELLRGECLFMEDANGNFFRVVDVVLLRVSGPAGRMLVETHHQMQDGRKSQTNRLPGTKKRPHESIKATARRLMSQYLRCPDGAVEFREGSNEIIEEMAVSPAYPGVQTVYRKYISEAYFATKDDDVLEKYGLPECYEFTLTSAMNDVRTWAWWSQAKCEDHGMAVMGSDKKSRFEGMKLADPSLETWTADEIREKLIKHGINTALYGKEKTKSFEQVANEVQRGESYLMESNDKVLRVVESVIVRVIEPRGKVLVETKQVLPDGSAKKVEQLPSCQRKLGDNVWRTAQRLLETGPKFANENVRIKVGQDQLEEKEMENDAYPGLLSVYRKHYVDAVFGGKAEDEDSGVQDPVARVNSMDLKDPVA